MIGQSGTCILIALMCFAGGLAEKQLQRSINKCVGVDITLTSGWPIGVNKFCDAGSETYHLIDPSRNIDAIFESYGRSNGATKYQYFSPNGTIFMLTREIVDGAKIWTVKGTSRIYLVNFIDGKEPPSVKWIDYEARTMAVDFTIEKLTFPARKSVVNEMNSILETTQSNDPKNSPSILHPMVGKELGKKLRPYYAAGQPVESIALDNLLDSEILRSSLSYLDVPIDQWEGPENGMHCCYNKYRLNFDKWNTSASAKLQSLINNQHFIEFLEGMTGIDGLVPVTVQDDDIIQLGSSMIAITTGGYLTIHNDFNRFHELYRRVNVLLYLNEGWRPQWQGHLELWDDDAAACVTRIAPLFNRMAVFTVSDLAFHGHPEPIAAPNGEIRYALQLVYYTLAPPVDPTTHPLYGSVEMNSDGTAAGTRKRKYKANHSAIFQPTCSLDNVPLARTCTRARRQTNDLNFEPKLCECNYR